MSRIEAIFAGDIEVTFTYTNHEAQRVAHLLRKIDRTTKLPFDDHDRLQLIASALERAARPPKPSEPTGLGAVVEVSHGVYRWARAVRIGNGFAPWFYTDSSGNGGFRRWDEIDAVRILSPGVES